ncbi:MAG TPA: hypothetical protein GX506_09050 [Firmicutes bacterium]|nr:hypothetical protein [Bacillota bacterium]
MLVLWAAFVLSLAMTPMVLETLRRGGLVRLNYRGNSIPTSCGMVLVLASVPVMALGFYLGIIPLASWGLVLPLFLIASAAFAGLLDDALGGGDTKGFRGHLGALIFEHRLSTGAVKAIIIFLSGVLASTAIARGALDAVLKAFVMALSANLLNLLDTMPGRAIKAYILGTIPVLILTPASSASLAAGAMLGAALGYLPAELRERGMLGDMGSNILGLVLGYFYALNTPPAVQFVYFLFLVAIHVFCERYSLSRVIRSNPLLRFLDGLGRGGDSE